MGHFLRIDALWLANDDEDKLDIEAGLAVIRKALESETEPEQLRRAYDYALDTTIEDLAMSALQVLAEDGEASGTYDAIIEGYRAHIKELEASLQYNDVTKLWIGDLRCYITGGLSYGERSETGELWFNLVIEDEDPAWCQSPYADILYNAMFVHPSDFFRSKIAEAVAVKDTQLAKISAIVEDDSWGEMDVLDARRALREVLRG
jgi:hypothetical protein